MFLIAYTSLNNLGENINFFNDDVTITCSLRQFYCTQVSTKTLYQLTLQQYVYKVSNEFPVMVMLASDQNDQTTRWHH